MTQEQALQILKTGTNVFLTGEPGSGKTHTINAFTKWLRECGVEPAITASTGIAATHIGGYTIHSWSGIGIKKFLSAYDLDKLTQNERVVKRVRAAHTLIIDEVSMLSAATLSMADDAVRAVLGDARAFGGLQIVLVGDFFQLPPIVRRQGAEDAPADLFDSGAQGRFAFDAEVWDELNPIVCYLGEQHRQEDPQFLELLLAMRRAEIMPAHRKMLVSRKGAWNPGSGAAQLFSHNVDVDRMNDAQLAVIAGEERTFAMESRGNPNVVEALKRGCLSPEILKLKIGARVMFTKNNFDAGYVNGTLGTVVDFSPAIEGGFPIIETLHGEKISVERAEWSIQENDRVLGAITQLPLRLAWAMTIHKSQGLSLDAAHMDLSRTFEYGQGYVALSRVRTLAGLTLGGLNERALEVHPEILERDESFQEASETAEEAFAKIPADELQKMHAQFIKASGGHEPDSRSKVQDSRMQTRQKTRANTFDETLHLLKEGKSIEEIAEERGIQGRTIVGHLEELWKKGKITRADIEHILPDADVIDDVHNALRAVDSEFLRPVFDHLGEKYSYDQIRLAKLLFEKLKGVDF
ncbi:MAG: helix-turn-helix domain-containing protein [Minisyncoccia bacterium]